MISNPLFSIVIPTYKGEESLFIALESIYRQTYKNIEVIVSDDNGKGTDSQIKTQEIIDKYKKKLNINYLINKHVNGSHARNKGLEVVKGEYISLLDDDDFYLETFIEDAISSFKDFDILMFDVIVIKKEGVCKKVSCPSIDSKSLLFEENEIGTGSNICIKRRIIDENNYFDERYIRHQDIEYMCKLLNKYKYKWINKTNIIKYYNSVNNYPDIKKAISMQKLIREDMLKHGIINDEDSKTLEKKQLHALFNDYLAKQASNKNVKEVFIRLKAINANSFIDNYMFYIYIFSKKLFQLFFSIYAKIKLNNTNESVDYYMDYRSLLLKGSTR